MTDIAGNLMQVRERIAEAASKSGREPDDVTLIAVTKTRSVEEVVAAYQAGVRHFGENRVREGVSKIPDVRAAIADAQPTWHMIGHIQSRKAELAATHYDYVHSVDRLKIARYLARFAGERGVTLPVLLECNVSGEESKYGFNLPGGGRAAFFAQVEEILALSHLSVHGLMTMAPFVDDPETVRPVFADLRALLDVLRERFPACDWRHLSMGMSNDFVVAVEEGATMVRIGRAIFGERMY
ncbi:MAG TPA: YggS family pyridoxal phosphate-dependent enzyme [Chloroflexi bacterium]|nr:YggS family pyridoxal phosphate-dependent enzyme [Chloroflexota bacterium]